MPPIAIALIIGAIGGVVAALCGVGGGVVMVPAFVMVLKMDQKGAVATSLAAVIFTAVFTTLKNHSNGLVSWKVAIPAGLIGGFVGWLAADALKKLQNVTLTRVFAIVIILLGIQMWWQSFQKSNLSKCVESVKLTEDKKN